MPSFVFSEDDDCSKLENDQCDNYTPPEGENDDKNCIYDIASSKCKLKECKDMDPFCESFIPNDKSKKCFNTGEGCGIKNKECDEFINEECHYYVPNADDKNLDKKCIPSESGNCSLSSCESLNAAECQNFGDNNGDKQCINIDGSCKLVECKDLPDNQCNKFTTDKLKNALNYQLNFVKMKKKKS